MGVLTTLALHPYKNSQKTMVTPLRKLPPKRLNPSMGQELAKFLLDQYRAQHPEVAEAPGKWGLFAEIVTRITNDVSGNRYALAQDRSQISAFDRIFNALQDSTDAFMQVLNALPGFTKGIVQTPHPTEVLTRDAIDAEGALHTLLENNHVDLFAATSSSARDSLPPETYQDVLEAMSGLYNQLTPLTKSMTPKEEMARSVEFSQVMFDSLPITMQAILEAGARTGAYDPARPLTFEELSRFNFLLQPETWSPGDRDSKELMTEQMLASGLALNERSMKLHYIRLLAEMVTDSQTTDMVTPSGKETSKDVLKNMIYRLMAGITDHHVHKFIAEHLGVPGLEQASAIVQDIHARIKHDRQAPPAEETPENNTKPYREASEFIADLNYLREVKQENPQMGFAKYMLPDERPAHFDKLDAIIVAANNFGFRALRSQIRENSEMHENVMATLLATLASSGIVFDGYDVNDPKSAMKPEVVKAAIDALMKDGKDGKGNTIHDVINRELERIRVDLPEFQAANAHYRDAKTEKERARYKDKAMVYKFFETLRGFQIAAEHPEAVPRYLIAECHGSKDGQESSDILAAFFMLKAMESNEVRYDLSKPKVEIVPLFEYRDDVENAPQTVTEAYRNEYFRAHHNAITNPRDPAITKTAQKTGPLTAPHDVLGLQRTQLADAPDAEHISVKEAKERFGIKPKEGDEKRTVAATKIVMYAGSDITKSAGSGGAGLVMHTTNAMREKMLDMDVPVLLVDYTGVGGGVHRSQPVATAFETAQGRSLRQTPQSIAQKILMQAGRAVRKILGLEVQPIHYTDDKDLKKQAVITAQLNMGNIAALPWNEEGWLTDTKPRLDASMTMYQELYNDPAYSAFFDYTADIFVKVTSYGARGASRTDTDRPYVEGLRAIGYGAALNASGSCAGLYYGASAFLGCDDAGAIDPENMAKLKELYLKDPIAQDRINRASYGVMMADMKTAWQYLGYERQLNAETGQVSLIKNGQSMDLDTLAAEEKTLGEKPDKAQKAAVAAHVLAKIDKEYMRVSKGLLALNREVRRDAGFGINHNTWETDDKQLLAEQPKALKSQIDDSLWYVTPARKKLAKMFDDIASGRIKAPKRPDENIKPKTEAEALELKTAKEVFSEIYYAMGSIFETFENVPRAYTRMRWALDNELSNSRSLEI